MRLTGLESLSKQNELVLSMWFAVFSPRVSKSREHPDIYDPSKTVSTPIHSYPPPKPHSGTALLQLQPLLVLLSTLTLRGLSLLDWAIIQSTELFSLEYWRHIMKEELHCQNPSLNMWSSHVHKIQIESRHNTIKIQRKVLILNS